MNQIKEIIVIYHEHLDAEWARCNDRPHKHMNSFTRSYMDVFEKIADTYFALEKDGFTFAEGETYFWRNYITRHPQKRDEIRDAVKRGHLEIVRQGDLVVDTNYSPSEAIVRNFLISEQFYDSVFPEGHWAASVAFPWDAFGNSANMPQIYKLSGVERVAGEKYRIVPDDYWVGIDGTKIPCLDQRLSNVNRLNDPILYVCARHPQCPDCGGNGCEKCDFRGFTDGKEIKLDAVEKTLRCAAGYDESKKYVIIGGEEAIPNDNIIKAIEKLNKEYAGKAIFRFGKIEEFWEDNLEYYESVRDKYNAPTVDLNPVNAGCYTTRIKIKQRTREIAYALVRAEAFCASKQWKTGEIFEHREEFRQAWENINLCIHHDSLGGTVIDGGYDELMDYLDEAQSIAYRFGAHPEQHIAKRVGTGQLVRGVKTKVLGDMEIKYDLCGIISIIKNGKDLFGEYRLKKQCYNWSDSRQVRIGELALMDDWGSAYSWYRLSEPLLLGQYNYAVIEKDDCLWWRGRRDVGDPSAKVLQWDIVIRLSEDGKRLNFVTDIDWDTTNRRIKVLIPVNDSDSKKSTWEIPFGFLEREYDPGETHDEFAASQINDCIASPDNMQRIKKLSECGENDFKPNACAEYDLNGVKITGEYPALHWVRHDINEKESVSILNKGIPSARWIPRCFEISLLRSPQMHSTLTVLPHIEDMWDIDGYTDKGKHRFEYSIWPEIDSLSYSELVKAGYEYNKANPDFPFDVEGDVVVTAFKLAENGDGFVLRVQEASGKESKVRIDFKEKILFEVVNLMEKTIGEKTTGSEFATTLRPYEIKSFRLRK